MVVGLGLLTQFEFQLPKNFQIFFIQTSPLHWSIRNLWGCPIDLIYNSCCWLMLDCCQTQFETQSPRNLWPEPPSLKPLSSSPPSLKGLKLMLFWNSNNLNLLNKSTNQFFKTQGIIQPAYLFHADCVCKQQSCWRLDPVLFKLQLKCQSSAEEEIEWMTFDRSNTMNLRNRRRKWMC